MKVVTNVSVVVLAFLCGCSSNSESQSRPLQSTTNELINPGGFTIKTRFRTPPGFIRQLCARNSFEEFLQGLPVKQVDAKVRYYNGTVKEEPVYDGVIDMDISKIFNNVPTRSSDCAVNTFFHKKHLTRSHSRSQMDSKLATRNG